MKSNKKRKINQKEKSILDKNSAAPVLSHIKNCKTLKKRKLEIKKSLQSPYNIVWPDIDKDIQDDILKMLASSLSTEDLRKPILPKGTKCTDRKPWMQTQWQAMSPKVLNLRSQLSIGISKTLRLLQRDELALLVVDTGTPASLHKYTLHTAGVKGIHGVSKIVAPLLGLDSVISLGFKVRSSEDDKLFDELIEKIRPLTPSIVIPWADFESNAEYNLAVGEIEEGDVNGVAMRDGEDVIHGRGEINSTTKIVENLGDGINSSSEDDDTKSSSGITTADNTANISGINHNITEGEAVKPSFDYKSLYVMKCDVKKLTPIDEPIPEIKVSKFEDLGMYKLPNCEIDTEKFNKPKYVRVKLKNRKFNPKRPKYKSKKL